MQQSYDMEGQRTSRSALEDRTALVAFERLPLVRQQLAEPVDGMGQDTTQNVVEVGPGVEVAGLA